MNLKLSNLFVELFSVVEVRKCGVDAGLHDPQRSSCQYDSLIIQSTHQHIHSLVHLPQNILS